MMEGSILKALYLREDFSQQVPKGKWSYGQEQDCQRICRHRLHRTM